MAVFTLRVLGDPVLLGPGGPVTGRASYRRRLALLSILAVARGRPVGRERIIGLLWPENPADAARHTLSEALYVLRKELAEDVFLAVGDEVALNAAVVGSDVDEFETAVEAWRLESAVDLYGGPLLDGFYVGDAPDFERWVEGERDRLARTFAQSLEGLALAAETAGDGTAAVRWWSRLAAHDRYSSRVALRLVRALDAVGDRMAALRFAGAHAVLLRQELGGEPDRELAELVERLRARPLPVLAPEAAPAAEDGTGPGEPAAEPLPAPASPGEEIVGPADGEPPVAEPAPLPRPRRWGGRHEHRWALALAGAAVAVVAAAFALGRPPVVPTPRAEPRYDPRRVAVLYLDDHSPGGELGYLANGLTEMLIHELAQVEALDVVSRNGVKQFRDRAVPMDSLAADLRAGTLVEGSVQRSGDSVRVTVQLIDANSQTHLESRSLVRPLDARHLFALQEAVAAEVSAALRRRVGWEVRLSSLRREAGDPRALELALRAGEAREDAGELARSPHPRDVAAALRMLDVGDSLAAQAARLDGHWSEPVLQRGWLAVDRSRMTRGPAQRAALREALERADELLRRRPGSVDALELRGTALWLTVLAAPEEARDRPWLARAERDLRDVVAADPDRASAWGTLGQLLRLGGDLAEGELAARRAREADAYLTVAQVGAERLYRAALAMDDLDRARHWCEDGRRSYPDDYRFRECGLVLMARDGRAAPRPDSAWRLLAEADRVDPPATAVAAARPYSPVFRRMMVAAVLARAGLADSARAVSARARRWVAGDSELRSALLWDEAYLQLLLGDRPRAAALLDTFVARRPALREYVRREPAFRGVWRP